MRKCPKCKSPPIFFTEVWKNSTIQFEVTDGKIEEVGYKEPGEPYCVEATCSCGHRWRLRGVTQITDLVEYGLQEDK